jgi:AraC-like DNA-binding protein
MHDIVSTDRVDPGQRLAYWTDMVCGVYVQLECDAVDGSGDLRGSIAVQDLGSLQLSRVRSTPQRVRRTDALVGRANEDFFLVSIQTEGEGVVHQDDRAARLTPGDFALYDSTRPYTLQFDQPFQQFVLRLPGPVLRTALRDTHRLTANTVSGQRGAGHLMINMIRTLACEIDTLAPASAAAVAESVTQILVAGLAGLPQARQQPLSQLRGYHRERIKACVREHLREPGFGVTDVAARLRVSPSTLQRAWAGEACALGDWIWSQRLDAARRDLCDPALAARGISEIAFGWGFNDAAHFSRAFRSRFGSSPRQMRSHRA